MSLLISSLCTSSIHPLASILLLNVAFSVFVLGTSRCFHSSTVPLLLIVPHYAQAPCTLFASRLTITCICSFYHHGIFYIYFSGQTCSFFHTLYLLSYLFLVSHKLHALPLLGDLPSLPAVLPLCLILDVFHPLDSPSVFRHNARSSAFDRLTPAVWPLMTLT